MALALQQTDSAPEQSWSRDLVDVLDAGAELRLDNSSFEGLQGHRLESPGRSWQRRSEISLLFTTSRIASQVWDRVSYRCND